MATIKQRPRVGDECWEVEWREDSPDSGEDDEPRYRSRNFPTRAAAFAWAKENFHRAEANGVPLMCITPFRFVPYSEEDAGDFPHSGFWDAVSDMECYEGE